MKVKRLIEILQSMPQEANVSINLRQSENMIDIDKVKIYKSAVEGCKPTESVEIIADWVDFKLDEEESYFCDLDREEMARPSEDGHDDMCIADQKYDEWQDQQAGK